jgi:hypothetical protein
VRFGFVLIRTLPACCVAFLLLAPLAHSQNSPKTFSAPSWATAPDRWRLVAPDSTSEGDTVSPEVRAKRSSNLLRSLRMNAHSGSFIVDYDFSEPDVSPASRDELNMLWVVGTFTSFHVYDADGTSTYLYTEVNFTVNTVINQPKTYSLTAGSVIDITLYGGKLQTKDGAVHSFNLAPSKYALEPNHRYILALRAKPDGSFTVHKQWDVTDGTVQVSSRIDEVHVQKGESQIVGLSVPSAISLIQSALSPR